MRFRLPKYVRHPAVLVGSLVPLVLGAWTSRGAIAPLLTLHREAPMARRMAVLPPMLITLPALKPAPIAPQSLLDTIAFSAPVGASGAVYLRVVRQNDVGPGTPPGIYPTSGLQHPEAVAVMRSFHSKLGEWLGSYLVGYWPAERHWISNPAYANPAGFIEVTPDNEDTPISAHFRLRDFITHDQRDVWPKYVVLREPLLDKLELVLADLERHGIPASHAVILSGFRTPAYNMSLGDASGRSRESRHQYGDAADIIIDANHDGRMDDLNGDGRVDVGDVRVIEAAVNRVERAHPELAGGLGVYEAMGPSGPFAHVDVRGWVARWDGNRPASYSWRQTRLARGLERFGSDIGNRISVRQARGGQCSAPPEFIALCGR